MSSSPNDSSPNDSSPNSYCTRTNAVLALYLDGDIDGGGRGFDPEAFEDSGFELVCPETLANHLRECEICHVALQRARRLDAALAESAGRAMAPTLANATADRLLDGALARAAAEADEFGLEIDLENGALATTPARQRAVLVPALLLMLAVGGIVGLWFAANERELPEAVTVPSAAIPSGAPESAALHTASETDESTPTPAEVAPSSAPVANIEIAQNASQRLRERLATRRTVGGRDLSTASPVELAGRMLDEALTPRERIRAATALFEASRPGTSGNTRQPGGTTLNFVVDTLAAGHAQPQTLADAFLLLRREAHVLGYLRTTLRRMAAPIDGSANAAERSRRTGLRARDVREAAALVTATRLGDSEVDELIRRVVRRDDSAIDVVAAALRIPVRPTGGAALLLDCWGDLARRHEVAEAAVARHLFAAQPRQRFAEVEAELDSARSVQRRVRCLLALASSPDPQCVDRLLKWATASCRNEAYAAAWSLSQLPHDWLNAAARRAARDPGAFVLRAALAHAGLPAAAKWTKPMRLTAAERTVIGSARYELFPRLAEWFRDGPRRRSAIADD